MSDLPDASEPRDDRPEVERAEIVLPADEAPSPEGEEEGEPPRESVSRSPLTPTAAMIREADEIGEVKDPCLNFHR